ncbi:MAG: aminotransferase class I/II-fold pyridoxal phosphate-dependent enzyme [Gemmatimonadota bacterium]
MSLPRAFASDNTAPAHPAVFAALQAANEGAAPAYGNDVWTARAIAWFKQQFGESTEPYLVWNGTGANVVALRALTRPFNAIICTEPSHINIDECGAPELLTGCKLIDVPTPDGKITPAMIERAVRGVDDEHSVQARVVSIAQSTERGTVYTLDEVTALCRAAHGMNLLVHMDGSRIANAAASLNLPFRAFTRDAGVDILSFGATKNGCMGAEAVLVFDPALAAEMKFLRKQSMQLSSKMRFVAAQILALAENDLWLANARNANAMARRLVDGVRALPGLEILHPVDANAVFAMLPAESVKRLQQTFKFFVWNEKTGEIRWMCNWATSAEDVEELVKAVRGELGG